MTKYRICKNKHGWYKIQEEVRYLDDRCWPIIIVDCLLSLCLFPIALFIMILDCIGDTDMFMRLYNNWNKIFKVTKTNWVDLFINKLFETQELAEKQISKLLEEQKEREEKSNNDWECRGEYEI